MKTLCYYYKDSNYVVYKYPVRLDVQQLNAKKQKKLIKDLYILKEIEITQQLEPENQNSIDSTIDNKNFVQSSQ